AAAPGTGRASPVRWLRPDWLGHRPPGHLVRSPETAWPDSRHRLVRSARRTIAHIPYGQKTHLRFQGRGVSPTEGSCRFPLIVLEQTTQPFLATHNSVIPARPSIRQGEEDPVLLALVIALLEFLVYGSGDLRKHASPNHSRASLNLIVEPGLYMLLSFRKQAVRENYETGNQAFSMRLRFLTIRVQMAKENPTWGYDRIVGALANLGQRLSDQTVGNILRRHGVPPAPKRKHTTSWKDFIRAHMDVLVGTDFFTVEVLTLK